MMTENEKKIVERLTRNLSHEIKNPLTTIKGYAQLITLKCKDEFAIKSMEIMEQQIDLLQEKLDRVYNVFNLKAEASAQTDLIAYLKERTDNLDKVLLVAEQNTDGNFGFPQNLIERLFSLLLDEVNYEYFPDTTITIEFKSEGKKSLNVSYSHVEIPEEDADFLFLPYSSKTLFKSGCEFYEIFAILDLLGLEYAISTTPEISFRISL